MSQSKTYPVGDNPFRLEVGKKALITTDNWFMGADGQDYKAVFGTVRAVRTSEEALGVKTNAKSTNWYVEIGNTLIAGCQIHYAVRCDKCELGEVETYSEKDGEVRKYTRPSRIYNADEVPV